MTKAEGIATSFPSPLRIDHSTLVIGHSSFRGRVAGAFTILELLIVMTVIAILAGLTIATMGYAQNKSRRSRAEAEIAAISAACENYKADNGVYPRSAESDALDPSSSAVSTYAGASLKLYETIAGDADNDRKVDLNAKSYFAFKPTQLSPSDQSKNVTAIADPFGNSYGYSTAKATTPAGTVGFNPTFDLWSTNGETAKKPTETMQEFQARWTKNW